MTSAAPAAVAAGPTSTTATPGGDAGHEGGAAPAVGEQAAAVARKLKLRGLDGDDEREYDEEHVVGLAQRGKRANQILSKAEQRAQEAAKREAAADEKLSRLKGKDVKSIRAALREMGVDLRGLAEAEVEDYFQEKDLTPEQKRIRELEGKEQERSAADTKAKQQADQQRLDAEQAEQEEQLSHLFMDVMKIAKLPKSSAKVSFRRLATLYHAAAEAGVELTPDVAAERVRGALKAEQKALFYREEMDDRGQKREALDMDALEEWFSPEEWLAINRRAVAKFKAGRQPGMTPPPQRQAANPEPAPAKPGPRRDFWKELKARERQG